jgi:AraC-like DNA-binding protein
MNRLKHSMNAGTIRVAPLMPSRSVLARFGVDVGDVLDECGLDEQLLADPDNAIDFGDVCHFAKACAMVCHCEHYGLLLAREANIATLGAIGVSALRKPQVGSVISSMLHNIHMHDQGATPFLTLEGGNACLGYVVADYHACGIAIVLDTAIGVIHQIVASLCGPNWRPLEVRFAHRQPADIAPYRDFFMSPLRFDAPYTALVFKERDLRKRVHITQAASSPTNDAPAATSIPVVAAVPFPILIRRVVQMLLATQRCTVADAADLLDLHRRTLNRRLKAMGLTFRDLADEACYVHARQLLAETDIPLARVAKAMGYAELSTFTRRFGHWSGTSPGQWRKQFRHCPEVA